MNPLYDSAALKKPANVSVNSDRLRPKGVMRCGSVEVERTLLAVI